MSSLDYKKFQKIASDNKCTILKHKDGHELKIAHKGLTSKLRADLDKLPVYKAQGGEVKRFDDGGDSTDRPQVPPININLNGVNPSGQSLPPLQSQPDVGSFGPKGSGMVESLAKQMPTPQAPQASVQEAANQMTPEQVQALMDSAGQAPQAAPQAPQASSEPGLDQKPQGSQPRAPAQASPPQAAAAPAQTPAADIPPMAQANALADLKKDPGYQQAYQQAFQAHKQEFAQQDMAFAQDIANGHITPETYESLYAKKDTLGKVGTIFGMLLGGMGSGLTHQPNVLLGMMQNQIDNDLKAQVQSKNNAQTYLNTNINALLAQSQSREINQDILTKAYGLSQAQMLQASYHDLVRQVNKMSDGPQKQAAQQSLGVIYLKMGDKINNIGDAVAGAGAATSLMPGGQSGTEGRANMLRIGGQNDLANTVETHSLSGVPEVQGQSASRPIPEEKRDQVVAMQTLDDKGRDLLNFIKQHGGTMNPKTRAVATQKIEEMKNYYNNSIKGGALTEGRLGWYDEQFKKNPTDILPQLLGSTAKLNEMVNSNANRKGILLNSLGFKVKPGAANTDAEPKSDEIRYDNQGNAWKLGPQGKPIRVK